MNVRVHSDGVRGVTGCARSLEDNNLGEAAGQAVKEEAPSGCTVYI